MSERIKYPVTVRRRVEEIAVMPNESEASA